MFYHIIACTVIYCSMYIGVHAQSGMNLESFSEKLHQYFDDEMIADIQKQLPDTIKCNVWSWDIADYSGDTYPDLAFVVKNSLEKRKIVTVYLFADIEGYLSKIAEYEYQYIQMPLEVGIVIRYNTCFITQKKEQFNWSIKGFTLDNGFLIAADEFTTSRIAGYTKETYRNFQSLESKEKLIDIRTNTTHFDHSYLTIPVYPAHSIISKGYKNRVIAHAPDFAVKGAFYWQGDTDCSFEIHSMNFDAKYLNMTISVTDDKIVQGLCDTCTSDYLELWFDTHPPSVDLNQYVYARVNKKKKSSHKNKVMPIDSGIIAISIKPGDFLEVNSSVSLIKSEDISIDNSLLAMIKHSSRLTNTGYSLTLGLPLALFSAKDISAHNDSPIEIGFSAIVHDCDNQYRPEEETLLATSAFDQDNPESLGSLIFLPENQHYGKSVHIFSDLFFTYINDLGF